MGLIPQSQGNFNPVSAKEISRLHKRCFPDTKFYRILPLWSRVFCLPKLNFDAKVKLRKQYIVGHFFENPVTPKGIFLVHKRCFQLPDFEKFSYYVVFLIFTLGSNINFFTIREESHRILYRRNASCVHGKFP